MNISYNEDGTPGRGSAIFLHCLGDQRPYTGGCVAIPRNHMITVLRNVKKDCVVVIDSLKNISPEVSPDRFIAICPVCFYKSFTCTVISVFHLP